MGIFKNIFGKDSNRVKLLIIGAIISLVFGLMSAWINNLIQENKRKDNVIFITERRYKAADSSWVTETTQQTFTIAELKKKAELGDSIAKRMIYENQIMGLKLRKTETLLSQQFLVNNNFKAQVEDTFWIPNIVNVYDTIFAEKESFTDGYLNYNRIKVIDEDSSTVAYQYTDTLFSSVNKYKDAKWFLPKLWKHWSYKLNAKFSNPKAVINHQEFINIKKKGFLFF